MESHTIIIRAIKKFLVSLVAYVAMNVGRQGFLQPKKFESPCSMHTEAFLQLGWMLRPHWLVVPYMFIHLQTLVLRQHAELTRLKSEEWGCFVDEGYFHFFHQESLSTSFDLRDFSCTSILGSIFEVHLQWRDKMQPMEMSGILLRPHSHFHS